MALVVTGSLLAALAQRYALHPFVGPRVPYATLFPSVLLASWLCGATAGALVSVVGVPLCAWLFVARLQGPSFGGIELLVAIIALVQCLIVSLLCGIIRRTVAESRNVRGQAVLDFENMADHSPGFVWSTDGVESSGFVNQAWRTFTGVSPNRREVDRLQLVHPADLSRVRSLIEDARAACVPYQVEYRLRRADGAYRWILEHAVPRLSRDGRFEGFTGSGTDVTTSHQERDELRFIGDLHRGLAASLDLHKTAETVTRAIVPALADWCAIHLVNEPDGELRPIHIHHIDSGKVLRANEMNRRENPGTRLPGCFARILHEGEPRVVEHIDEAFLAELATDDEHLAYLRTLGLVSFVGVPLRVAGRAIGVLSFASAESCRVYGADSLQLTLKVGGIAAFALENARLHRGVRDALAAEERARRDREHSDRQFRSAWEADIFGICLIDRAGRIRAGNDTFLRLAGHTRQDLAAGRVELRSRVGDREHRFGAFLWENVGDGRRCEPFEKICIRADGAEVPVLVGGSVNSDGATAIVFMLDLTARKAAEAELTRQRGLLKTIIDAVPAMVAYIDPDERFVLHNLQYEKWLGLGPEEIRGKTVRELMGEEAYAHVSPLVRGALAGHALGHETVIHGANQRRDLMVNYRPDRDASGRVVGVVMHAYDITESRRMAAELARSERRHRTLITNSAAIVWTADARGVLQSVDGWEQFTGIATEPGTCPMWFRLIHPADRERVKSHWLRPESDCHSWEAVYRMLAADGRYHHVHARAAAIASGPGGAIEEWIGTVTDITQRVEAEQSLRRKEAELKLIVDTMPALVAYIDRDLRYGLVNLAYEKWFGLAPERVRGRHVREVLGEKVSDRLAPRFARVMNGEEVAFEELAEYRHGGTRWINALYTPHRDEGGEVVGCFVLVLDITSRKQAEQQMAELAERYRFLADAMPQNVWTAGADGKQDYVNRRWCEYTGTPPDGATGERWLDIVHPEDVEETSLRWARAVATGESYEAEHRLRDASGAYHWFLSLALARRDQDGRVVQWVGTSTNIDAHRRAYLELAEARAELRRHADRLESEVRSRTARLREVNEELEAFTYSASHDLRVPLHHIHGFAQAILEDREAGLSPSGHANMRLILNAAERMDTLIMDLLAYSRLSRAEIVIEPTALEPILADVFAQHRGTIQAKHAVIEVDRPLPDVPADRVGLQQILFNLVGNALKFVPAGRSPHIRIRVERVEERFRLWVEDNGIGIDKRHHEGVFRLFQRLHSSRDYAGTGIGLSLVKRAAERMGGSCGVDSEPGRGSRFWVDFQPAPDEGPALRPASGSASALGLAEHAA